MYSIILPALLVGLAYAVPAPSPTLMTFTYLGSTITATYYPDATPAANLPCPTQTFTYNGAVITAPYTGPGTPRSCLNAPAPAASTSPPKQSSPQQPSTSNSPPSSSHAIPKGFNYGSAGMTLQSFQKQFDIARSLQGTSGFTSARLYTMIQDGTTNTIISAIPAAIATNTKLLIGVYYPNIVNELIALKAAIQKYGSAFTNLVVAISVGSEDLYRNSPTGIENHSNPGANPADIVAYIQATRQAIAGTALAGTMVGHVDTWTAFVNGSNKAVITASDFLGMDAYPYYQNTQQNDISQGASLFKSAYQATVAVSQGKPVWITETG